MSGDNQGKASQEKPSGVVRITIDWDPATSSVTYRGPQDLMVFLGMLDFARALAIRKWMEGKPEQRVTPARLLPWA